MTMMDLNRLPEDVSSDPDSEVLCTICLDPADHHADKTVVELKCTHKFHLDCIGSAFNAKMEMKCPNCRNVEVGQWQFPGGYIALPDVAEDIMGYEDIAHVEVLDPNYLIAMRAAALGWCPFEDLTPSPTQFHDMDFFSNGNTRVPVHQWNVPFEVLDGHHIGWGHHSHAEVLTPSRLTLDSYFERHHFVLPSEEFHYHQPQLYNAPQPDHHQAVSLLDLFGSGASAHQ